MLVVDVDLDKDNFFSNGSLKMEEVEVMKPVSKLLVALLLVVFSAMPALAEKTIKWKLAMT